MDDPNPDNETGDAKPEPDQPLPPNIPSTWENEGVELSEDKGEDAHHDDKPAVLSWWQRWQQHTPAERIMAYFTGVVAVCAMLQIWILIGGSGQTDQLIEAAKISAHSAAHNAAAAQSFAESADRINRGISDAVDRLTNQALASHDLAITTGRQTSISLQALENERPWLATGGAEMLFDQNRKVYSAGGVFVNGGRNPATQIGYKFEWILIPQGGREGALAVPKNNVCGPERRNNHLIIVPGTHTTFQAYMPDEIFNQMDQILSGKKTLYLQGCVDYSDSTGKPFRTYMSDRFADGPIMTTTDSGNEAY